MADLDTTQAVETLRRAHDELEVAVHDRTRELIATIDLLQYEVSERKLAEQALRESQERYHLLFESASDGVTVTDVATGQYEAANTAVLTVEDDGQGFVPAPDGKGLGLRIMRYRASIIGADLEVRCNPQTGGTIVSCVLRVPSASR